MWWSAVSTIALRRPTNCQLLLHSSQWLRSIYSSPSYSSSSSFYSRFHSDLLTDSTALYRRALHTCLPAAVTKRRSATTTTMTIRIPMIYGHDRYCNHNHYHNIHLKLKHNRVCAVAPFWLLHSRTYGTRRRKAGEHSQPSPSSSGRRRQQQQVKEDAVVVAAAGVTNSVTVDRETGAPGEPTFTGPVPRDVLTVQYSRSSGPGGQHANKVSSQAEVRFSISSAVWLTERTRLRLRTLAREQGHINKRDEVVIVSSRTRSQHKNLEDAISRVHALCTEASRLPRVATEAQKKKVAILQRAHDERRLKEKKRRKDNKRERRPSKWD